MSYFNTNKESGDKLAKSNRKATSQEETIFSIFQIYHNLSPSKAWMLYGKNTLLTSIRRAITNLCNEGKLIKTDTLTDGLYGKSEHIYSIK